VLADFHSVLRPVLLYSTLGPIYIDSTLGPVLLYSTLGTFDTRTIRHSDRFIVIRHWDRFILIRHSDHSTLGQVAAKNPVICYNKKDGLGIFYVCSKSKIVNDEYRLYKIF
jgi:hypothetical protein